MPKYSLTKKDKSYLTIEIEGKNYNIPLAGTMKIKEVRALLKITKLSEEEQFEAMSDFLSRYMGEDVVDDMIVDDVQEIFALWSRANGFDSEGDLPLGESSASHNS